MASTGEQEPLNVARNARSIEWLKAELVGGVSHLFHALVRGKEEAVIDALSNVVISCYVLAKRLGFPFSQLDARVREKLRLNIEENHQLEQWYGDLSALFEHHQAEE